MDPREKHELDNYSRQMNPEDDVYWQSRGYDEKPDGWEDIIEQEEE